MRDELRHSGTRVHVLDFCISRAHRVRALDPQRKATSLGNTRRTLLSKHTKLPGHPTSGKPTHLRCLRRGHHGLASTGNVEQAVHAAGESQGNAHLLRPARVLSCSACALRRGVRQDFHNRTAKTRGVALVCSKCSVLYFCLQPTPRIWWLASTRGNGRSCRSAIGNIQSTYWPIQNGVSGSGSRPPLAM